MSNKEKGLYQKFRVERVDGRDKPGGDRENAGYFVMDYIHDVYAPIALEAYANACEEEYPELATDIRRVLNQDEVRRLQGEVNRLKRVIHETAKTVREKRLYGYAGSEDKWSRNLERQLSDAIDDRKRV